MAEADDSLARENAGCLLFPELVDGEWRLREVEQPNILLSIQEVLPRFQASPELAGEQAHSTDKA